MKRIAINGFGRIGKTFLRVLVQGGYTKELEVVAINVGPAKKDLVAHTFKYDTLMGTYPGPVRMEGDTLVIDERMRIVVVAIPDPAQLLWKGIDWVVECSGRFAKRADASKHIQAGAQRVLISAPATGEDISIIPGVNDAQYDAEKHKIISLGSCSTNALVPTLHILHKAFGVTQAFMSTVHAYTNTQALLDVDIGDERRNRAAALNIVPTTTGAVDVIGKILPELSGLVEGHSIRVPVAKVSLLDLCFQTQKDITAHAINDLFIKAAKQLPTIIAVSDAGLVSSDFSGDPHSVIIDTPLTMAIGRTGKVFGWYDNEWGYSQRLVDFLRQV